jgi:hypothetical protein
MLAAKPALSSSLLENERGHRSSSMCLFVTGRVWGARVHVCAHSVMRGATGARHDIRGASGVGVKGACFKYGGNCAHETLEEPVD